MNAPARLQAEDYARAAVRLGVDEWAIRAVCAVESRGTGFLPDGQPVILFERHVMYRRLTAITSMLSALAETYPDLVNPAPGGYARGVNAAARSAGEHDRLARARTINEGCAIESASWGLFQLMGFHWQRLGFGSAVEFEQAMCRSEGAQLDAFVRFIETDGKLAAALRAHDWRAFAERYNGKNFTRGDADPSNDYDVRLAAAYEQASREA